MAEAIKFGLGAPAKLSLLGGVALIAIGGLMILAVLVWLLVIKRQGAGALTFPISRYVLKMNKTHYLRSDGMTDFNALSAI